MNPILAIDPGSTESAYVEWNGREVTKKGKLDNYEILDQIKHCAFQSELGLACSALVIEKPVIYQMATDDVGNTIKWTGKFELRWEEATSKPIYFITRSTVVGGIISREVLSGAKGKNKDSLVRAELIARFGHPGNKKNPGVLYGVTADVWQALALAVYWWDRNVKEVA